MFIDRIPQEDVLIDFVIKGIAACFPLATETRIVKWMIINEMVLNPDVILKITDDMIACGLVNRKWYRHRCHHSIVYNLTDPGLEALRVITRQS